MPPAAADDQTTTVDLAAPFQGIVSVLVRPGDRVEAGQVLAVIEAMKLEAPLTAPRAGTVRRVVGRTHWVAGGDVVVSLVP